jgi:membrane protease YdiL (CAAX protease family)
MTKSQKVLIIILVLMGAYAIFIACGLVPNMLQKSGYYIPSILLRLLVFPLTGFFIWYINQWVNSLPLSALTGNRSAWVTSLIKGSLIGIFIVIGSLILLSFTSEFSFKFNPYLSALSVLSIILSSFIIAFFEELIFRGFIFLTLISITSRKWTAAIISSIIFSFSHIQNFGKPDMIAYFVNLFLAGIILCIVFQEYKSIISPIALHFFVNFLNTLDIFYLDNKLTLTDKLISLKVLDFQTIILGSIILIYLLKFYTSKNREEPD